ncbi:hypothetical protein K439DRAFT_1643611 [Ramaria rubella]|nr:hypothetical protein K439DRAFT_1643611 [Ramaria rubella]
MIRWDAAGDHIIVEKPEQLALHVLPSIYRQSRFASFSRQLNIYGFMRKVNLRNVDPAIDDPDASTWSHPTLNRHSPPEVVANFKRRVPPRLPKPRKRADEMSSLVAPRSAVGLGPVPLTVPSSVGPSAMPSIRGRAPWLLCPGLVHWRPGRSPLEPGVQSHTAPPLTVPSDAGGQYHHSSTHLSPPSDDSSHSYSSAYPSSAAPTVREPSMYLSSSYSSNGTSTSSSHWEFPPLNTPAAASTPHSGTSLSSLLNHTNVPSTGYGSRLSISTNQVQPFNSVSMPTSHSSSSMSPDSRPTTGYSGTSSMSSLPYEPPSPSDQENGRDYDHANSRPLTPGSLSRPHSANKGSYGAGGGSLSIRRGRRHSQAVSPYPSPYEPDTRPLSASDASLPRAKSLMALSSTVDNYYMQPAQAEFAYSPAGQDAGHHDAMDGSWAGNRVRPSTSQSSLSAASHSSSSAANTPPTTLEPYPETDIHRCEYPPHPL